MDEVADELVEVLHRAMDSEKLKKERRRRDQERNFDTDDEALLERYVMLYSVYVCICVCVYGGYFVLCLASEVC